MNNEADRIGDVGARRTKLGFSPFLALVCAVFFFLIYVGFLGSGHRNASGASRVLRYMPFNYYRIRRITPPSPVGFDVLRSPDGIELEYVGYGPNGNSAIAQVSIKVEGYRRLQGLWASTVERHSYPLMFVEWQPLSDDDKRIIRSKVVDSFLEMDDPPSRAWLQSVARGEESSDRVLSMGYLHNSISLLWFLLIVYLGRLCWFGFTERRRSARLGNALCPYCKYNLYGLTRGRCPECGVLIPDRSAEVYTEREKIPGIESGVFNVTAAGRGGRGDEADQDEDRAGGDEPQPRG